MKRQIKFRAWDNHEKKWLMGYEYPNLGGFSMFGECMLMEEWSSVLNRFILQQKDRKPEDLVLMQFTGLLDKNGKEIYEGDIVMKTQQMPMSSPPKRKMPFGDQPRSISFRDGKFVIHKGANKKYLMLDSLSIRYLGLEVIGNIYEHPNLLQP